MYYFNVAFAFVSVCVHGWTRLDPVGSCDQAWLPCVLSPCLVSLNRLRGSVVWAFGVERFQPHFPPFEPGTDHSLFFELFIWLVERALETKKTIVLAVHSSNFKGVIGLPPARGPMKLDYLIVMLSLLMRVHLMQY